MIKGSSATAPNCSADTVNVQHDSECGHGMCTITNRYSPLGSIPPPPPYAHSKVKKVRIGARPRAGLLPLTAALAHATRTWAAASSYPVVPLICPARYSPLCSQQGQRIRGRGKSKGEGKGVNWSSCISPCHKALGSSLVIASGAIALPC